MQMILEKQAEYFPHGRLFKELLQPFLIGVQEGKRRRDKKMAVRMLQEQVDIKLIEHITGLPEVKQGESP
ncbi:hypothetical protein [Weizmannia acidilactici]|uniref:hypothetical protein n=1 Tax=Weizmannia acidilactici TaxID=2607726 RepID=UPI00124C572E|nr:hypothetical protein [Weizmannia acidilactici]GER75052.1 hypothetical protein BpPP18_31190 [Weizmannia acidilactici]